MMLEMFISEIRYGKSTLPECCRELATRLEEPYKGALEQACQEFHSMVGVSFYEIFVRKMEQVLGMLPLKDEDRESFLTPFRHQGFQDGQMQIKSLEQGLLQLSDVIQIQKEEQREKSRMAVGLGVMSGLLLIIIMV